MSREAITSKLVNPAIYLPEFSSDTNPKRPLIVAFSNFDDVVWIEKHVIILKSAILQYLRRSVEGLLNAKFSKGISCIFDNNLAFDCLINGIKLMGSRCRLHMRRAIKPSFKR